MSVTKYLAMQKTVYSQLSATRKMAEQAVHPNYQEAAREGYTILSYVLNDYAERTAVNSKGGNVEQLRRQLHAVSKDIRILDFGCGLGRLMEALAASGFRVDGVDISPEMIDFSRQSELLRRAASRFFVSRGDDCGEAPQESYDLVYSHLCFQHICVRAVRMAIFQGIRNVLKPDGVVSIQFQFYPGIAAMDVPPQHAAWRDDKSEATGTNSANDVWITPDMLPELYADFSHYFHDLRLQFITLPKTRFVDAHGRPGSWQYLVVSGCRNPSLHRPYFRGQQPKRENLLRKMGRKITSAFRSREANQGSK